MDSNLPNLQQLAQKCLASGMTQKAIAERIGCSQPTISDIAAGKIGKRRPTYQIVEGLRLLAKECEASSEARAEPA
jgi:transcriptional regulator with XRE-family HTH domain